MAISTIFLKVLGNIMYVVLSVFQQNLWASFEETNCGGKGGREPTVKFIRDIKGIVFGARLPGFGAQFHPS